MSSNNTANELFNVIKAIVDNYVSNRQVSATITGVYNGSSVMINNRLPVPMSMISGNMKSRLSPGDKVVLLRNDGGREYYILEITGKPYLINGE
ncbi:MAG: DNA helicase [Clostridiales bacterium]|nr:DNA helicase [Clostridiales bacterium]